MSIKKWNYPIFEYGEYAISPEDGRIIGDGVFDHQIDEFVPIFESLTYSDPHNIIGRAQIRIENGEGYAWVEPETYRRLLEMKRIFPDGWLTLTSRMVKCEKNTITEAHILYLFWTPMKDLRYTDSSGRKS